MTSIHAMPRDDSIAPTLLLAMPQLRDPNSSIGTRAARCPAAGAKMSRPWNELETGEIW
jgi:hypothetical protein